ARAAGRFHPREGLAAMSHVTLALIGAGDRGFAYGKYALDHPDEVRFVAVADPIAVWRDRFATAQGIAAENRFAAWEDLLGGPRLADAVIVATPDRLHVPPAVAALEAGYDVLL